MSNQDKLYLAISDDKEAKPITDLELKAKKGDKEAALIKKSEANAPPTDPKMPLKKKSEVEERIAK